MSWSLTIRLSKGRGQSSCRHLQLSGSVEWPKAENTNAWHSTEEISAFHQREGSSWMGCDKSYYWVISDFQELVAMVQADCMHSLFSFPALYFQQKVIFSKFWKEDNVLLCFKLHLHAKCTHLSHYLWLQERRAFHPVIKVLQICSLLQKYVL